MENNPVIQIYKGITIRKYNKVNLMMGEVQFKKLIDEVDRTGFSIPKILSYSSKPCDRCKDMMVVAYDKEGNEMLIKRGILSMHVPEGNGVDIITKAKNRNAKSDTIGSKNP